MEKVITVHLGHAAFLINEESFEVLKNYLDSAKEKLKENSDCNEIIKDIEYAIAEKVSLRLNVSTDVVTLKLITEILKEMGPVTNPEKTEEASEEKETKDYTRRLYQVSKGSILTGVCNGLAAYLKVDVLAVRLIFIILVLLTNGVGVFIYGILALVIPFADTIEKESKAHGRPFNAQTLVDQARQNYDRFTSDKVMHARWNNLAYEWRDKAVNFFNVSTSKSRVRKYRHSRVTPLASAIFSPVIGFMSAALFIALVYSIYTVTTQNQFFSVSVPTTVPLWASILGVVLVYLVFQAPLSSAKTSMSFYNPGVSVFSGFAEAFVILGVGYFLYQYVPEARELMEQVPQIVESVITTIKESKAE